MNFIEKMAAKKVKTMLRNAMDKNGLPTEELMTPGIEDKMDSLIAEIIETHGLTKLAKLGLSL